MLEQEEIAKTYKIQYMDGLKVCVSVCTEEVLSQCIAEIISNKCTVLLVNLQ
jgi:hypothetical protein